MKKIAFLLLVFAALSTAAAGEVGPWCATPSPPAKEVAWFQDLQQTVKGAESGEEIRVPVAFHVLTDGKNGLISLQQINTLIGNLNFAFRDTPFTFYLLRTDLTKNKKWYKNCAFNAANQKKLRKKLALDTRYVLNVYSCKLGKPDFLGLATFPPGYPIPGTPGENYLQGVAVDPIVLGSRAWPYGLALAHEVGHYLGLFHTFEKIFNPGQEACTDPGDFVADTPTVAGPTFGQCPIGLDSCPALAGLDDIENFMGYSTDECWKHFTSGQVEMMLGAVQRFRPRLGTL